MDNFVTAVIITFIIALCVGNEMRCRDITDLKNKHVEDLAKICTLMEISSAQQDRIEILEDLLKEFRRVD